MSSGCPKTQAVGICHSPNLVSPVMLDCRTHLGGMILTKTEGEWQVPVRQAPESGGIKVRAVKLPASGAHVMKMKAGTLRSPQTSVSTQGGSEFGSDSSGSTVL